MRSAASQDLTTLPGPRAKAVVLACNPDATLENYVAVVETDPALTAAVLRAANAAAAVPMTRLLTAHAAVVRIGVDATRALVMTAIMRAEFDRLEEALDARAFWRHLLATGLIAEQLLESTTEQQYAFTAGLLHDLGRLSLAARNSALYRQVVELAVSGHDVRDAERSLFGLDHTRRGFEVADVWGLPAPIAMVIDSHHEVGGGALNEAVRIARSAARSLGLGDGVIDPEEPTFDDESAGFPAVEALGGPDGLLARIRWFQGAIDPRGSLSA